jgi:hypothetical protein
MSHAVLHVIHSGRLDRPDLLQLQVRAYTFELPCAAAEQQWDDVQLELVDEPGRQVSPCRP